MPTFATTEEPPHDQGYREYKRQTLFDSKPPNNELSRDSYQWEQHKNDEFRDEFEDWDDKEDDEEDDEDWDWDDEDDEEEDWDEDDENDYEDEDDVNISLLGLLLGNHTTDTEEDEEEKKRENAEKTTGMTTRGTTGKMMMTGMTTKIDGMTKNPLVDDTPSPKHKNFINLKKDSVTDSIVKRQCEQPNPKGA